MPRPRSGKSKAPPKPSTPRDPRDTPAMRQYQRFKESHPDCVLFFRMGDFYEMFFEDAELAHRVLGVTLTQRTAGVPMAGVPHHAVEQYLRRMIQAGHRVAVADQIEAASEAKGVVDRAVTRVVTPGTLTDEVLLDEAAENPLAAVMFLDDDHAACAWAELSTGAFYLATFKVTELTDELARVRPSELLYVETADAAPPPRVANLAQTLDVALAARPAWQFRQTQACECVKKQYQVATLAGFGLADDDPALGPASAVIHYLMETQKTHTPASGEALPTPSIARIAHLRPPQRFERHQHLVIDHVSLRSLEIERTMRTGQITGSLLGVLSDCRTAMGKRLLRRWLCYPLCDGERITARQRIVGALVEDSRFLHELREALDSVQDIERITARIAVDRATPRDLVALGRSAAQITSLCELLAERPAVQPLHDRLVQVRDALTDLAQTISRACDESPPAHLRQGGVIRDGFDTQLDEYRALQRDSSVWLAEYQKTLIDETSITTLKVGFNKVFGYYIEVSAAHRDKAPDAWTRKQTLKNAERYTTPPLKEYENKVLSAEQRAIAREQDIFANLCAKAQAQLDPLHELATVVAKLDVFACFAQRAVKYRYVKPIITDEPILHLGAGRHPVLDELLADRFVPNEVSLGSGVSELEPQQVADSSSVPSSQPTTHNSDPSTLALITGPNMAGKSTYIRQAALITLLAHTGSFVPAESAVVGLCDRIFTRIGASDELHTGQSTFMVEMTETANICHHATQRSLVILDEIGRGTSTLDGLSLAWAIAEHLAQQRCRTLFATHYHEITQLAEQYENVVNLNVAVREWQDEIVFLHRIVPGAADRSYGIHVAKIAGLPTNVVERANELLGQLEVNQGQVTTSQITEAAKRADIKSTRAAKPVPGEQLPLFTQYIEHPAIDQLRAADLNAMTPLDAFDLLRRLRKEMD